MRRWFQTGIVALAAAMFFAAGCSGKADNGSESQAESQETAAETEEYVAESSITLGEYKGIPVTVTEAEVTDEEIESQIQQVLSARAEYVEVDREAQSGDQVNIDYKGLLDGEAFEGGTAEGADLVLGSGSFIDGFEDGLIGAKKGESRSLDLTFPEEYPNNPDLAGKAVVFEVTVNAVKEHVVPELTDALVAEISSDASTVEEYRQTVKDMLLEQKQMMIDNQRDTDLLDAIVADSEIVCSTEAIDEAYETQLQAYTNMVSAYGLDLATYAGFMGMDEESLKAEIRDMAKEMAKQELVLREIAKIENITVTQEDQEEFAREYGYDSLEALLENDNVTEEMVEETTLFTKTMKFVVENAEITVEPASEENQAESAAQ